MTELETARAALQFVVDKTPKEYMLHQVCAKALADTGPTPRRLITSHMVRDLASSAECSLYSTRLALCETNGNYPQALEFIKNGSHLYRRAAK